MIYLELDLDDELFNELRDLAEKEGMSVEELITEILKDEVSICDTAIDDDDDEIINIVNDDAQD